MIAATEYERLLRVAIRRFYRQTLTPKKGAVEVLLDRLATMAIFRWSMSRSSAASGRRATKPSICTKSLRSKKWK